MCRNPPGGIMCMVHSPGRERRVGKGEEEEAPVSAEENKALVRWWWEEVWGKGNVAAVDEFMAANYVDHPSLPGLPPGPEGMKQALTTYRTGFPDLKATLDDILAEGDRVALRWSARDTHLGEWLGVPPTGQHFTMSGISVFRIAEGKAVEGWNSIEVNPTEEEQRWLSEGGGGPSRSGDLLPATERDPSPPFWDVLTRNLTWGFRVAEAQERERIEQELQVARRIQQASLPKEVPEVEGWEITPYYQPAREVGGDFYDFFELEDGRLGVVVGDATGKGVPAALVMASTRSMLRAVAQASNSPGDILRRINDLLVSDIPPNMFVTCFYAILDPKSGSLRYANAGHDLPYLRRRSGDDAEELRARGMPLGLMPGMSYEEKEATLEADDRALFYSDGLVEAHEPQRREMFGFPRLRRLVAEHAAEEGSLVGFLMDELRSFTGEGWEQEDDITLVTLRRSGARR
jgi:predicted ester cyclase